ncbi:cx9C motif-containing protein 4-like [Branchiostoma floridae x Branchiostoma japonicum]
MKEKPDPCQRQACDIQVCLQANNYKESRCESVLRAMERCCEKPWAQDSVCCSGFRKTHKSKTEDMEKR